MYCARCGAQIPDGSAYCPKCGQPTAQHTQGGAGPTSMNPGTGPGYDANNAPATDSNGVVILVLGIVSVVFAFVYTIIGLICGIVGLVLGSKAKQNSTIAGMTKIGYILSLIGVIISAALLVVAIIGGLALVGLAEMYF